LLLSLIANTLEKAGIFNGLQFFDGVVYSASDAITPMFLFTQCKSHSGVSFFGDRQFAVISI